MRGCTIALALSFVACGARYDPSWTRIVTPQGTRGYVVECSRTPGCVEMAGDLCPTGYSILGTGRERDYEPGEQQRENASAAAMHRWPADMSRSIGYATIECTRPDSPSLPAQVTVTKNPPPRMPQKASSYSSGLEDEK